MDTLRSSIWTLVISAGFIGGYLLAALVFVDVIHYRRAYHDASQELAKVQAVNEALEKVCSRPQVFEWYKENTWGSYERTRLKVNYEYNVCLECHTEGGVDASKYRPKKGRIH